MKIENRDTLYFVVAYHALILLLMPFCFRLSHGLLLLSSITYIIGGLSITVGYHRLYAHKAYDANPF